MTSSVVVAAAVAVAAVLCLLRIDLFQSSLNEVGVLRAQRLLSRSGKGGSPARPFRVAVGWNANVDAVVNATVLFESWGVSLPQVGSERAVVNSISDFLSAFLHHAKSSTAAERFITNRTAFDQIYSAASSAKPVYRIGGNAALMASELNEKGCYVTLAGRVGKQLRSKLATDIEIVNSIEGGDEVGDEVRACAARRPAAL